MGFIRFNVLGHEPDKAQQEICEPYKLCSKALKDNLGINVAKNSRI
jgi:hypothetical protein